VITCTKCERSLGRARLVIGGRLLCADCVYELEYGPTERREAPVVPRLSAVPLQEEHLFPLPPPRKRGER
jgi:hypothetical protein